MNLKMPAIRRRIHKLPYITYIDYTTAEVMLNAFMCKQVNCDRHP